MKFSIDRLKDSFKSDSDQCDFDEGQLLQSELNLKKRCNECAVSICNEKKSCAECGIKNIIFSSPFSTSLYNRISAAESMSIQKTFFGSVKDRINISRKITERDKKIIELIEGIYIPSNKVDILGFLFLSEYEIKKYAEKESSAKLKSEIHGFSEIRNTFFKKRNMLIKEVKHEYPKDIELMLAVGEIKTAKKLKKKTLKNNIEKNVESNISTAKQIRETPSKSDYTAIECEHSDFKNSSFSGYSNDKTDLWHSDSSDSQFNKPSSSGTEYSIPPAKTFNPPKKPNADSEKTISGKLIGAMAVTAAVAALLIISGSHITDYVRNTADKTSENGTYYSTSAVIKSENTITNDVNQENSEYYNDAEDNAVYDTTIIETTEEIESEVEMVWITETGRCYHSKPNCGNSNQKTSFQIPIDQAVKNYSRCSKCW